MKTKLKLHMLTIGLVAAMAGSVHAAIVELGSSDGSANETYKLIGGGGSPITDNITLNNLIVGQNTVGGGGLNQGGLFGLGQGLWDPGLSIAYSSLVIEVAGYSGANNFGIYDSFSSANNVQLFPGSASANPLVSKTITFTVNPTLYSGDGGYDVSVSGGGSTTVKTGFGFYLDPNGSSSSRFYSENSKNTSSAVQIVAWDINSTKYGYSPYSTGNSGWLLGAEDLVYANGDKDFNDLMVTFTAHPVPEPTTIIAGALLLLPFGASTIRFLRKNRTA